MTTPGGITLRTWSPNREFSDAAPHMACDWQSDACPHTIECGTCGETFGGEDPRHVITCFGCDPAQEDRFAASRPKRAGSPA
jgi:hypothetical protein